MALTPHTNVILRAAEKAAKSLVRDFGEVEQLQVSRKGPGDFVSAADHRAEEIIFEELRKARPDYDFLMEERGGVKTGASESEYRWIVDPLDGTTNFLHGIPHWCISIALEYKKEIVSGVIFDPIKDEVFRAEKGLGAFMRNKRLRVSGRTVLPESVIATGTPTLTRGDHALALHERRIVMTNVAALREMGSAALCLAYVAAGRHDAYWEYGLKAWDMAAGAIIIRESGGFMTTVSGEGDPIHSQSVLAANSNLHSELKKLLSKAAQEKNAA